MLFAQLPIQRKFRHVAGAGCSRLCPSLALKTSQDQGRRHFTEWFWSTKAFSPSLVFSSFCHELLWSTWMCFLSSFSHQCQGFYWVPPFSCLTSTLNCPRNHSLSSQDKGPSPIISVISAEFSPYGHYLPLYKDPELDIAIWDLRSNEQTQTIFTLTELCHTSQGNACQGLLPPHELFPSSSCKGWTKTGHLSLLKFLRFPSPVPLVHAEHSCASRHTPYLWQRNTVGDSVESLVQEDINDIYPSTWLQICFLFIKGNHVDQA